MKIQEVRSNIKRNITLLRTANGLKMREVANALGVKENTYRTWEDERTVSSPKPDKIIAIAKLYDVSVDFIMNNEEDNIKNANDVKSVEADKIYGDKYLNELSAEEKLHLMRYRILNSRDRKIINEKIESIISNNEA